LEMTNDEAVKELKENGITVVKKMKLKGNK
jgi:hypothetical protein